MASCYRARLDLAARHGPRSIAFPCIGTGIDGLPKDEAAAVAVREVHGRLAADADRFDEVVSCCFGGDDLQRYQEHLK